jgi:hypothetical protein
MPNLASVPDLDEELDRLYGLPPEEFTAARNDLAKRLRAAGQKEAADETKARKRPPASAWAVNRLARDRPDEVRRLARAGERLVQAQTGTLAGGGPAAFASARAEHADTVRALTAAAAESLADAGRPATQQTVERIARTLRSASLDDEARPALVAGRLADDVDATGFALLEGLELPAAPAATAAGDSVPDKRARASALRAQLREAKASSRDLDRQAARQREIAERAQLEADEAAHHASALDSRAADARSAVEELQRELDELG